MKPPRLCLRAVLPTALLAGLATVTSCASPAALGTPVGATGTPITLVGPATVVSADGPTTDGVFVGRSVAVLLTEMQRAGHGPLSCAVAQCWQGRSLPAHTIGVAFQANQLGCEQVDYVRVSSPRPGGIRLGVRAHPVCTRGGGAAAKGRSILVAVPRSSLPAAGEVTAQVELAMRPGDSFEPLGNASAPL